MRGPARFPAHTTPLPPVRLVLHRTDQDHALDTVEADLRRWSAQAQALDAQLYPWLLAFTLAVLAPAVWTIIAALGRQVLP